MPQFVVYQENHPHRYRVAEGTAEQVIVQLLGWLDTQQLHNLQTRELPKARERAVMNPDQVAPITIPVPADPTPVVPPGCEHGWNESFDHWANDPRM